MRTVVIYPGRFHPFHRGHKASYDYLTKRYGDNNVFVVSSNKQDPETSPFSFADKLDMMTKLGISPGQVAQVTNPYQAKEIRDEIDDPENTVLIFAVSEKDMAGDSARFNFRPKKDGTAGYMQPLPADGKGMQNMTKHAYVAVTPTVNFKVRGADANSASQIRKLYQAGNEADREQIIADLYGDVDAGIKDIFDRKLGTGRPEVTVDYGAEQIYAGDKDKMVKESRSALKQKITHLKETIDQLKNAPLPGNLAAQLVQLTAEQRKFLTQYIAQLTSLEQQIQQARQQSQISNELIKSIMALTPDQKQSVLYLIAPTWNDQLQQRELNRQQWHAKRANKNVTEYAVTPDRDDDDEVPEMLHRLANRWWNAADKQPQIEATLNSMGWSIQQVESEDDAVQLQHQDGTVYFISADEFDPDLFKNPDYIEEKWSQKYKSSINCSNPKGFSQRAHCAGRKKKVNESSGYSLQGSFTPDLIESKVWLLKELGSVAPELDTVYILGSWYGNLALYMHLQPTVEYEKIINVETDADMLAQSERMLDHVGVERVEHMFKDANKLDYQQLGDRGAVINTSLTDMPGTEWFENIPGGTLVVLQARDQDPGEQYHSTEDIVDKFPLDQVYYTGTRSLQDPETGYQRFMVIGRK
jgi:hypothetical protein